MIRRVEITANSTLKDFIFNAARDAVWTVVYHEKSLMHAPTKRSVAKALLLRCDCDFSLADALDYYDECEGDMANAEGIEGHIKYIIGDLMDDMRYQEDELTKANKMLAIVAALIKRGGYDDIDMAAMREDAEKQGD